MRMRTEKCRTLETAVRLQRHVLLRAMQKRPAMVTWYGRWIVQVRELLNPQPVRRSRCRLQRKPLATTLRQKTGSRRESRC